MSCLIKRAISKRCVGNFATGLLLAITASVSVWAQGLSGLKIEKQYTNPANLSKTDITDVFNDPNFLNNTFNVRALPDKCQDIKALIKQLQGKLVYWQGELTKTSSASGRNEIQRTIDLLNQEIAGFQSELRAECAGGVVVPSKDFWITGMQVIQAVQTPDNRVPLIGFKTTFVRVYVQSVFARSDVRARLTVRSPGGGTQELLPILSRITVSPTGSHLDRWDDSFNFRLDSDLTAPGARDLGVRIYSASKPGDITKDHIRTVTARFSQRIDFQVYGVRWAVTNGADRSGAPIGPAAPWSDFEGHRRFVENVFPVSTFTIIPVPGIGQTLPDPQPFGNLTESRDWACKKLNELPSGSIINLLDNWDTGGLHGYWWCGKCSEEQNQRTNGRLGNVMAQEVAHALGLTLHTFDPGSGYPRTDGSIGSLDMGIDITGDQPRIVSGASSTKAFDIMSYNTPPPSNWVSAFTYCRLMSAISGGTLACPPGSGDEPRHNITRGRLRPQ